ncbi:hypothetical protein GGS26DRAFT_115707 [Hypomontagnella submonticulosa]|nr:hypothetical protein GGS26DRAFT_115707 [Hypomontagnella submonticulosa]
MELVDTWHFEYFRVICTRELSSGLGTRLWESHVLPAAFTERFILHGVLALGALSRNMVPSRASGRLTSFPGYPAGYSMSKYNLAIQGLNRRLKASPHSWELAVLGSLIFTSIETLQGRDDVARMHLRGALAILANSEDAHAGNSLLKADLADGLDTISRFDTMPCRLAKPYVHIPLQLPSLPPRFRTINEARDSLSSITSAINSLHCKETLGVRSSPLYTPALALTQDITTLSHHLESWQTLFSAFIARRTPDIETKTCVQILLIHHQVALISVSTFFYSGVSGRNTDVSRFSHIIELARDVLRSEQESRTTTTQPRPGHSLDVAIVQPLFYTACKCKDGIVRRRAIELMDKIGEEAIFSTRQLSQVARWVVAMEEQPSPVRGSPGSTIKEEDMLHDIELTFDSEAGTCSITAWRRVNRTWHEVSGQIPQEH